MLIDASVALKLFLEEDDSAAAVALLTASGLEAPELIVAEVANGLWKAHRRGILSVEVYRADAAKLLEIFSTLHPLEPLVERATSLAVELDHPVYDCFYLACAEREGQPLITADKRLLQTVVGSAWEPICRAL